MGLLLMAAKAYWLAWVGCWAGKWFGLRSRQLLKTVALLSPLQRQCLPVDVRQPQVIDCRYLKTDRPTIYCLLLTWISKGRHCQPGNVCVHMHAVPRIVCVLLAHLIWTADCVHELTALPTCRRLPPCAACGCSENRLKSLPERLTILTGLQHLGLYGSFSHSVRNEGADSVRILARLR